MLAAWAFFVGHRANRSIGPAREHGASVA